MAGENVRGRFLWYDLMTTAPDSAVRFYTTVLDWGTEVWEGAGEPYTMWTAGGAPLGGVMELPAEARSQGAPPNWMAYVGVPDTDAACARATGLGGAVLHGPQDIPTVGRFAVLRDPQGAVIAVFTPSGEGMAGPQGPPAVGRFSWHELATDDVDGAFAFYAELFDWEKLEAHDMGEMGVYQIYGRGGVSLGGMYRKPAEMPVCAWVYYVRVADLDVAVTRVKELGGQVVAGPMEVPGGDHIAICCDPQGAMFSLHHSAM